MFIRHLSEFLTQWFDILGTADALMWKLSGSQGDKWIRGKVGVRSQVPYSIVIEGVRGKGIFGDIAIDDISYSNTGFCTGMLYSARYSSFSYMCIYFTNLYYTVD